MNVRVHKRDFTHQDYERVKSVRERWGDEVVIENADCEEIAAYEYSDITSIEIRPE